MSVDSTGAPLERGAGDEVRISPTDWEARAAQVRQSLTEDGAEGSPLPRALGAFRFLDDDGRTWSYDGAAWLVWDGDRSVPGVPPPSLRLQKFMVPIPEAAAPTARVSTAAGVATPAGVATSAGVVTPAGDATPAPPQPAAPPPAAQPHAYRATHIVPAGGLPAWSRPDPSITPEHRLDPGLDVMVAETYPSGWARIVCSNTWSGWIDGRLLVPIGPAGAAIPPGVAAATGMRPTGSAPAIGSPTGPAPSAQSPRPGARDVGFETGLAALLGFVAWLLIVFAVPVTLRFTLLNSPYLVGLGVGAVVLAAKAIRGRPLGVRGALMFVVDAAIGGVVFWLFLPG